MYVVMAVVLKSVLMLYTCPNRLLVSVWSCRPPGHAECQNLVLKKVGQVFRVFGEDYFLIGYFTVCSLYAKLNGIC